MYELYLVGKSIEFIHSYSVFFYKSVLQIITITVRSMKLKRSKLQIIDTEKKYYNLDRNETGLNSFWKIFLTLFIILIVIIVFITCYRYIYGQIIYLCKRCLARRNKETNTGDNFSIIKENESGSCIKRRFLWPNTCTTSSMEKKKLLAPRDNKIVGSTSNVDFTKQFSLDMSCSSFSSTQAKYKSIPNPVSNRWNTKESKNYKDSDFSIQNIKNVRQSTYKYDKDICFSDTDLKFLVTPLSSKKFKPIKKDERLLLCTWNSGNINKSKRRHSTSSKLIDLKLGNTNSFSNNTKKYGISNSKSNWSPYSLIPRSIATDAKYFSDTTPNRSDVLSNAFSKQLKRSINSYTSSTQTSTSNTVKVECNQTLNINRKAESNTIIREKLTGINSQRISNEHAVYAKKMQRKIKSSVNILRSNINEVRNPQRSKSDVNFVLTLAKNDSTKNLVPQQTLTSKQFSYDNENIGDLLEHSSQMRETYDELGILFSQYIKLQTHRCNRNYCVLKRHLKRGIQHSTRKCQTRFHCHQIYPFDQRPTCNSGNICTDTYDELKLMCTSPGERKGIYQHMFRRRKQFLNQPYTLSD